MEGWTEEEIRNKSLMAPCGLYCGVCGVYIATRDENEKFKAIMGNLYGTEPEETECLSCMQPDPPKKLYGFCKNMPDQELCEIERLLLLPSMSGMAMRFDREFWFCYWRESDEKNDSYMAV
jgi:hypothetical protein